MKKVMALVLILVLMLSTVGLVACGGGDDENGEEEGQTTPTKTVKPTSEEPDEEDTTKPTAEPDEEDVTEPTSESSGGQGDDDIAKIVGKAMDIKCFKVDMVTSSPGEETVTQTMWKKNQKFRSEMDVQGQTGIVIMDVEAGVAYSYMPTEDQWLKLKFDNDMIQEVQDLLECDPRTVGSGTVDGKACTIVETNCLGIKSKGWIWKDKGLMLKSETETPQGISTVEYKNYDFKCADDSLFELPEGVEVLDMSEMLEGLEGENAPEDFQMPEGFEMPEGVELPEGFQMPQ